MKYQEETSEACRFLSLIAWQMERFIMFFPLIVGPGRKLKVKKALASSWSGVVGAAPLITRWLG